MYLINPTYEILSCGDGRKTTRMIERVARTCYKSEDKINENESDLNLVTRLLDGGHLPMIEFGFDIYVKFISDRGFSHELVRHRLASFAQESTRYCNYSKGKFGRQLTIVDIPDDWLKMSDIPSTRRARKLMLAVYELAETNYMKLVEMGVPPDAARSVLPQGLKAEINIKANPVEWRHIFSERCSKRAHPRMRELMTPLLHDVAGRVPLIFNDLAEKFPIDPMWLPTQPINLNEHSRGYQYVKAPA